MATLPLPSACQGLSSDTHPRGAAFLAPRSTFLPPDPGMCSPALAVWHPQFGNPNLPSALELVRSLIFTTIPSLPSRPPHQLAPKVSFLLPQQLHHGRLRRGAALRPLGVEGLHRHCSSTGASSCRRNSRRERTGPPSHSKTRRGAPGAGQLRRATNAGQKNRELLSTACFIAQPSGKGSGTGSQRPQPSGSQRASVLRSAGVPLLVSGLHQAALIYVLQ